MSLLRTNLHPDQRIIPPRILHLVVRYNRRDLARREVRRAYQDGAFVPIRMFRQRMVYVLTAVLDIGQRQPARGDLACVDGAELRRGREPV